MPRRIMREFRINEISAVDSPAQKGARATILKRDEPGDDQTVLVKGDKLGMVMVQAEDGHQHLLDVTCRVGETSYASAGGDGTGDYHTHPYMVGEDGRIEIGLALGHSHELDQSVVDEALRRVALNAAYESRDRDEINYRDPTAGAAKTGIGTMTEITQEAFDEVNAKADKAAADLEKAQADNERLAKIAGLNGTHKSHYDTLEGDAADEFLGLDEAGRDAAVERAEKVAKDENPVVYTADNGDVYRKSDDPRLVTMAKERDEDRKALKAANAAAENARIEKRATDLLKRAPGETATHVAIVKAVEGIKDDAVRDAAFETLKGLNDAMAKTFDTLGENGEDPARDSEVTEKADAEAKLDKLAKAHADKHGIDYAKAYTAVLATDEGKALYRQTV